MRKEELIKLINNLPTEDTAGEIEGIFYDRYGGRIITDSIRVDMDSGRIILVPKGSENYEVNKKNWQKEKSFKTKKSKHRSKFMKMYNLKEEDLTLSKISNKTRCKKKGIKKIINKGMGAYYSSGSRPNQTPHSWGVARLYSALTGGPATKIDKKILLENCKKNSKIIKLL